MRHGIRFLGMMCALGGIVAVTTCNNPVFAQLRGEKNASILNYLGRYHGVGYSDGYHTCPDKAKCSTLGVSQAQLYDSPSSVGGASFRPLLGVQDRWIGIRSNAVGIQTYSSPSTIVHPNVVAYPQQRFEPYSTGYNSSAYGVPTPAAPVHPSVPEMVPGSPQSPRSLIPGQFSPSDNNPRILNPTGGFPNGAPSGGAQPNGEFEQPVRTGPVSLPAEFYNHYSNVSSVMNGQSQAIYSQSQMGPQTIRPQMNIGQPASGNASHSILRQSSLAPSSY